MKLFLLFVLIFCYQYCFCQLIRQTRTLDSSTYALHVDSLQKMCGNHKKIPKAFVLPILLSLSYFPELDSTDIVFKPAHIKTTLNVRPTLLSVLMRNKLNRRYIVRVNNKQKDSIITLSAVPFNAKIGLLGHELNHIVDYRNRNMWGIMKRLLSYTSKQQKTSYEKAIDMMTINRGLGWQLFDWSWYVLYQSKASQKYKHFKQRIYLQPQEIETLLHS